jgi:glutathione S-transferase
MLTLYGMPSSTYVRTVRLLLSETNADYDLKDIGIFNGDNETAEYLAMHPFGKIPTLVADGEKLYETSAITYYVDQTLGGGQYSPSDPLMQARMRQIMSIVDSYLYGPAVGTIVIQRLIVPQQGGEVDETAIREAIAPTKQALEAIERLCVGTPFLLGSLISLADFYLIPIFVYLAKTQEFDAVTANTPKLRVWWEQTKRLNSVQQVCA